MLFNFLEFIQDLREKEDKKELIEKYEKFFGPIAGEMRDQIWYKEYLVNFGLVEYAVPEELKTEFDWKILMQMVAGSFSSECLLDKLEDKEVLDLVISVKSGDQSVVKRVSELRSFQIMRLYEIYLEEQLNLQVLIEEDEKEKEAILSQRQGRIQKRKGILENLNRKEEAKVEAQQATVQKESQLTDLYSQL